MKLYFWIGFMATMVIGLVVSAAAIAAWNAIGPLAGFIVWAALIIPAAIAAARIGTWSANKDYGNG